MIKRGSKLFSAHGGAIQEFTIVDIYLDGDDIWPLPIIVMINQYGECIVHTGYPITDLVKTYEEAEEQLFFYQEGGIIWK